ncbi:MAG TPA: immunoglobulin domain-containing protein [Opitutaceae bacterium]|nr:immunoglobulin domain-containing protein [Opitutaceae bacterium]
MRPSVRFLRLIHPGFSQLVFALLTLLAGSLPAHAQPYTRVYGWGANGGQLGNNTTVSTFVPTTADLHGKTITQVCMGGTHTLALTSDGLLYAWGGNNEGQLGNNSTTDTTVPVLVNTASGVSSLSGKTIVSLAASGYCSYAVTSDGIVHAWGWNGPIGMLGNNSTARSLVPIEVDRSGALAGKVITKVSGGRTHALALSSDGKIYAWGSNYNDNNNEVIGLLGNGSGAQFSLVPVAVTMSGALAGKTMTGIAAGGLHSLACASDGTVYGWGSNYNGPLGNGSTTKSNVPTPVNMGGAMAGKTIVALGAGYVHSVALASDGTAYAWGYGGGGRLGNSAGAESLVPVAVKMNGELAGKTLIGIATGTYNTAGLANDGTVYTWGSNFGGSLGVGDEGDRWEPTAVVTTSGISGLAGVTVTQLGNCTQAGAHFVVLGTSNFLGVPDAPSNLATTGGNSQVTVSFNPPGNSGGSAITGYTVTASPGGATATGTSSPITVIGLANGTAYTFTVTATNASGTSIASSASASITPPIPYVITTFAGSGSAGATDATGTAAQFNRPRGVALDSSGNLYVADYANHSIRKITSAGVVTTLAGSGSSGSSDATGILASFNNPHGVAVDSAGNVYVADTGNNNIRKITSGGVVTTLAGSGSAGSTNATGTSASFRFPSDVAVDGSGNVFVADYQNHKIRKITSGGVVTTYAGGSMGFHSDGTGTSAYFYYPSALVIDSSGNLYVTDSGSHTIRKITTATVVTTPFGSPYSSGATDATGTSARFNSPMGIDIDSSGTLFVSDENGHRIRKITSAGVVTTIAGSGSTGSADGTGSGATFNTPNGIVVSPSGVLYITDYNNHKIRAGSLAPAPVQTSATTAGGTVGASFSHQIIFSNTPTRYSAAGLPAGLSVNTSTGTISGTPTAVGTSVVTLGATNDGGSAGGTLTITIAPGAQTISFGALADKIFGDVGFTLSASASSGLTPAFSIVSGPATISGNTLTLTAVGTVIVRASQAGNGSYNAATPVDQSFAVTKATAPVALGSLAASYNGSPKNASTSTTPTGLTVDLTYNGSVTAPTNAGSYTVVGTINDSNYQGTAGGTLVIAKATQTVTFGSLPATVNVDVPFTIGASASTGLPVTFAVVSGNADVSGVTVTLHDTAPVVLRAAQAGDANRAAASSDVSLSALQQNQTITFAALSDVLSNVGPISLSASASSGLPVNFVLVSGPAALASGTLTLAGDAGTVVVRASQPGNAAYSAAATVERTFVVTRFIAAPVIVQPPVSVALVVGQTALLNVVATGEGALIYQWFKDDAPVAGATNSTLSINVRLSSAGSYFVAVTNAGGTTPSAAATLAVSDVPTAPVIVVQPAPQTVSPGDTARFNVMATGTATLTYQWRKNGVAVPGATSALLTLVNVQTADVASYDVVVRNAVGSTTSSFTPLTIVAAAASAPVITRQPANTTVVIGDTVTLTVAATGASTLTYQWQKDGAALPGATDQTLVLANIAMTHAGGYAVIVSSNEGSTPSRTATVRVLGHSYAGSYFGSLGGSGRFALHLRNDNTGVFLGYASGRSYISRNVSVEGDGRFTFTPGTTVSTGLASESPTFAGVIGLDGGLAATSGPLTLAAARSIEDTTQHVAGLYAARIGGASSQIFAIVGPDGQAFLWMQTTTGIDAGTGSVSSDGRIVAATNSGQTVAATVDVPTRTVTVTLTNQQGQSTSFMGTADQSAAAAEQRMVALSARARVSAEHVAIVGFIISGEDSKSVLVRAVGPALSAFGVSGALAAPRLDIYRGGTLISSNAGWNSAGNAAEIAAATIRSGAVAFAAGSGDSAVLATLAPGAYTAVVSSPTGAPGVTLVEIYDLAGAANGKNLSALSARAFAGTGADTLIAGVIVHGVAPKRVLIRAAGPSLAAYGVPGVLARSTLKLYAGPTPIAENAGWSTSADAAGIAQTMTEVGAFPFAAGSGDSAILINLPPGAYTAQVTGVNGTSGVVLLEVYEAP